MSIKHLEIAGIKQSLKGQVKQAKGTAKETIGELAGNDRLKIEGKIDRATGAIQEAVGKVEQKIARKL